MWERFRTEPLVHTLAMRGTIVNGRRAFGYRPGFSSSMQGPAHLVEVGGDDDVQAGPGRTLLAYGDQRDALPGPLRAELIAGELGGEFAQHRGVADHSHQLKYESVL